MKHVRVVIIGFGGMGSQYAKLICEGKAEGVVLSGICCRNIKGRAKIQEQYPSIRIYQNVEDTFEHRDEFDAVVIVTPHDSHVEIGEKAAAAGKHILCDKPAGISTKEVRRLASAAKEAGISYAMIFNKRRKRVYERARELLDLGVLGKINRVVWVANTWFRTPAYHNSAPWRSTWSGEHGGLLINQCQHDLDIWQWLFGMPDAVYASLDFGKYNDFDVDDGADIQFFYDNGLHGTFISSSGENPGVNRLEVWGTKGRLCIEDDRVLTFDENVMSTSEFAKVNTELYGRLNYVNKEQYTDTGDSGSDVGYVSVFQNFADHIIQGTKLYADGKDGLNTLMLANGAYLSAWLEKKIYFPIDDELYTLLLRQKA